MSKHAPSRRGFIAQILIGAGALTLPPMKVFGRPAKERLGVALVGLGNYSTHLLAPALQQTRYCHLAGIVTGTPAKAEQWQRRNGIADRHVYDYRSFDRIANDPEIDVVYVVLPNSLHAEYVIRAAKAGKHVWCEKPMALSVKDCEAMTKACQDNKVSLAIGYRMQHEKNTQALIRLSKQQTYGPVKSLSAAAGFFDSRTNTWRQQKAMGGGAMYDMGVYCVQAARYGAGAEPIAVTAQQTSSRTDSKSDVDETTSFELEFPDSVWAHCKTSMVSTMNLLRVNCAKGWYQLEPFQSYTDVQGTASDGCRLEPSTDNQQAKQMDDDALAILQGRPLLTPGEEGKRDVRIIEAVFESARTGRRVVIQ